MLRHLSSTDAGGAGLDLVLKVNVCLSVLERTNNQFFSSFQEVLEVVVIVQLEETVQDQEVQEAM